MTLQIGDRIEHTFAASDEAIEAFAVASGDRNPLHFDEAYAADTRFGGRIAHGMLTAGFISTMVGMELPGPGTIYLGQTLQFRAPVRPGDDVRVVVEVTDYEPERRRASLSTVAYVGETRVVVGEAKVIAPA